MKHLLPLTIALLAGVLQVPAADVPSIHALGAGESLVVEYSTKGCFHGERNLFVFHGREVTVFGLPANKPDADDGAVARKLLGVIKLTDEDASKLDALFLYYASGPSGICTTVDEIKVSVRKGGKSVSEHQFTDASCGTMDMDSVLTLGALKARLQQAEPAR